MSNYKNTNNPSNKSYNNAIEEMNQFPPLTQSSSSTPGPPPFHITQTPLYINRCPLFSINPEVLRSVNGIYPNANVNTFDIDDRKEGYPDYYTKKKANQTIIQPPQTIERIEPREEIEHKYDILSDLYNALNRIGINATTMILIIIAVFFAVQFNQYNIIRNGNNKHNNSNDSYSKAEIDKILNKLNHSIEGINNQTIPTIIEQITINKKNINLNKENITESMQNNTNINNSIALIKESIDNKVNKNETIVNWFHYKETTNWISGVINKPPIIPYYYRVNNVNISNNNNNNKTSKSLGLFGAFKRGLAAIHNETIKKSKNNNGQDNIYNSHKLKYTANVDITDIGLPQTLKPNDCLQFDTNKQNRWIEIGLIEKIIPFEFVYIHIDKNEIKTIDRNKSPKRFRLYGKIRHGQFENIVVKNHKILNINQSIIKLELDMKTGIEFMRIEYDVNEGAKSTRLYRMRVHGKPDV